MTEVASTNTLSPFISNVLSIIPAAFSNCIEYEKPEHPPPTTPMRRPAGTGFCCAMMSFTLDAAFAVRVTGAAFGVTAGTVVATSGTDVVAISYLLGFKAFSYYSKSPCFNGNTNRVPSKTGYVTASLDDP